MVYFKSAASVFSIEWIDSKVNRRLYRKLEAFRSHRSVTRIYRTTSIFVLTFSSRPHTSYTRASTFATRPTTCSLNLSIVVPRKRITSIYFCKNNNTLRDLVSAISMDGESFLIFLVLGGKQV